MQIEMCIRDRHKIGKVTYLVCSSASERATDTLDKKIKKLIRKDMELNPVNCLLYTSPNRGQEEMYRVRHVLCVKL